MYLLLLLILGAQTGLVLWKKKHKRSYELVSLLPIAYVCKWRATSRASARVCGTLSCVRTPVTVSVRVCSCVLWFVVVHCHIMMGSA
jgi:hypothetical protein